MSSNPQSLISLNEMLSDEIIESSAPCRIDFGGTWDLKPFALPYYYVRPATVNIAINLRTTVTLLPFKNGWTKVSSKGFLPEAHPSNEVPFNTPLGFVFAIATYFKATGVHIKIDSESPPKSALGGSGVLGVALVHALSVALSRFDEKLLSKEEIVKLAYHIEDGLSVSLTGMQDQAAAAFGGVNKWLWIQQNGFRREELIPKAKTKEIEPHILIAYCGESHESIDINSKWVNSFLDGKNRSLWFEINDLTLRFARTLKEYDFKAGVKAMQRETELRQTITPEVLIPSTQKLVDLAIEYQCGARFAGAGGGGCVWAIGEAKNVRALHKGWGDVLKNIENAKLLKSNIDIDGVT